MSYYNNKKISLFKVINSRFFVLNLTKKYMLLKKIPLFHTKDIKIYVNIYKIFKMFLINLIEICNIFCKYQNPYQFSN